MVGEEIIKIYPESPAYGLLYKGDIVLSVNGERGSNQCLGPAGETIVIQIERCKTVKEFTFQRLSKDSFK